MLFQWYKGVGKGAAGAAVAAPIILKKKKINRTYSEHFKKLEGECYRVWPPVINGAAKCDGFYMCVHRRNVGCTDTYKPQWTWCVETLHRASNMGHASLLTNTGTTVLGHRRVYMAYISINSLFDMVFFLNSTFTKIIIRKIFRLIVEKRLICH